MNSFKLYMEHVNKYMCEHHIENAAKLARPNPYHSLLSACARH